MARSRAVIAAVLLLLFAASAGRAQQRTGVYPELRVDAIAGASDALHLGAGAQFPLGTYARLGAIVAGGASRRADRTYGSGRADVLMRFLLDPYREAPWGLSAGAGVSMRYDEGAGWRPFLAFVLDLEGQRAGRLTPALQLGLGGGARLGIGIRGSSVQHR